MISVPEELAPACVVAEIGCNHQGREELALRLVEEAARCGASAVKLQKRSPRECLSPVAYDAPYDNPHSFGGTYGAHREALELSLDSHKRIKARAEELGLAYACSAWDVTSARALAGLRPRWIKIPSACNHLPGLLETVRDDFDGPVHVSTGMSSPEEVAAVVDCFARCPERLTLYACTSVYPVDHADVCLLEIARLRERFAGRIAEVGFSGHHRGIALDVGAYLLGARTIERHFTLDRTWKGTDHAASLEPAGLAKLVRDLAAVRAAWREKPPSVLESEQPARRKLKDAHGLADD